VIPPYLHPDGTSILQAKPDHPATVEHMIHGHKFGPGSLDGYEHDWDMWHSMAHSEPRIETAITAALQLGADWRHLTITGIKVRYKDLLDLLGEAKEENDRLRGIIQDAISYHREEASEPQWEPVVKLRVERAPEEFQGSTVITDRGLDIMNRRLQEGSDQ
jgi:hypothetical protein